METRIQTNKDLASLHMADVFEQIYNKGAWRGKQSVSGPGSDVESCAGIIARLSELIKKFGISSMLDIPCGDFGWMSQVDLSGVDYIGADVVRDLIRKNIADYSRPGVRFVSLDMTRDELPCCDLVLCRDGLVHLALADAVAAVDRIKESRSGYLLCTTFAGQQSENGDIKTGGWRALNMRNPPFCFPDPVLTIPESNTGVFSDKSLALWKTRDLKK